MLQGWLTSGCIVTTINLTAETSDKYNEYSSAVWNACNSAWGWPALERELILALSVRLLFCNQQTQSCNGRKGSGTPSASHFHTAKGSQHSHIPSLYQPELFTSLSLTSAVCPPHLSLCTGSALFHLSIVSSCTFPKYFSLALSLIAFLLHVSLHMTLLLFLTLPYLTFTLLLSCFTFPLFRLGLNNVETDLIPFQPQAIAHWNPARAMSSDVVHTSNLP